eukprot:CAMPEP_0168793102 /NCGR_PEP_ID=MMETSP0725-20121227/14899_1 /TAXON_ID=265536 /ORGANISM="Amphiprora sp., Strain CCMP467" /LENGTH=686 /DNA_ID=CAMNT_0008843841 /DNA_START=622 /DNA_END=2683 /DNA_ORIENTATION=-
MINSRFVWICLGTVAMLLGWPAVRADAFLTGGAAGSSSTPRTFLGKKVNHKNTKSPLMYEFQDHHHSYENDTSTVFLNGYDYEAAAAAAANGHATNGHSNGHSKTAFLEKPRPRKIGEEGHRLLSSDSFHKAATKNHHKKKEQRPRQQVVVPVEFVAETKLPTAQGDFHLRAYRVSNSDDESIESMADGLLQSGFHKEPTVLYAPHKSPMDRDARHQNQPVPVRIHDQCVTSEVLEVNGEYTARRRKRDVKFCRDGCIVFSYVFSCSSSCTISCDCREQLQMALQFVQEQGGCVIYLQQEGRGIGLANKVAAYALQDEGMDTVDANLHLGFPEDCRDYGVVPSILEEMGILEGGIHLMTNNPRKVELLEALGVKVHQTIPMVVSETNEHNRRYLETKSHRMRHSNFANLLQTQNGEKAVPTKNGMMAPMSRKLRGGSSSSSDETTEVMHITLDREGDSLNGQEEAGVVANDDGYCFGQQSVLEAVEATRRGEIVVVVDDMDRENEGDFIMAAELCKPEDMATIIRYSSGVICIGMEGERMDELELPPMLVNNQDPKGTAFSVTVDACKEHGITTGISAKERSLTVNLLANGSAAATDFHRPGHILPLRAREGGVLERDGHTEASVDLARLAGLEPAGVLCEIVSEENPTEMMRLPEIKRFCKKHGFVLTSIADIAQYRRDTELRSV